MKTVTKIGLFLALTIGLSAATLSVPSGGNLQSALNNAQPGDTISLAANGVYYGNYTLPAKNGTAEIVVQTNVALPNARVTPATSANFAKLLSTTTGPTVGVAPYAAHWRLRGIEIGTKPGVYSYGVVNFTSPTPTDINSYPAHIRVSRCYIHGDPVVGSKRGVALNGVDINVENSYLSNFKSTDQDTQAIAGWTGPGPFAVLNNYLEGGQAIMFGGAQPQITNLVPSNITIQNNLMSRPMAWKNVWPVKNQLELKNAENVVISGNVIENNWISAQNGYIVLFTVRTCEPQDHSWAVVKNVTFTYNVVRNSESGVNILGTDNVRATCGGGVAGQTSNVHVANNVFTNIGGFLQLLAGTKQITVDHNTVFNTSDVMGLDGSPSSGFVFNNNIANFGPYGVIGTGTIGALTTFAKFAPGTVFQHNALIGAPADRQNEYPSLTYFPTGIDAVDFVNYFVGNYALASTSPYIAADTNGKAIGADYAGVVSHTATAVSGNTILGN